MAVYTHLDEGALRALWSVYDDDAELVRADGIPHGSINTTYRLSTEAGVYYLRINEEKTTGEVLYERDLLDVLHAARLEGVVTPVIRRTRIGGSFFLVARRPSGPVWAAIFPELPGRDLGVFEVTAAHTAQLGAFLARAHRALRGFHGGRRNPYGVPVVDRWLADLDRLALPELAAVTGRLAGALETVRRRRRLLPHGVVHGDLFVDNTKWHQGRLAAVFDWEMAGRDHLALDLAVCLHAWCWRPTEGDFDVDSARALVDAYQSVRRLRDSERRGFFVEVLFAAVRFTASRVRDFEVPAGAGGRAKNVGDAERTVLDYRDFLRRLDALESMGESRLRKMVGLA